MFAQFAEFNNNLYVTRTICVQSSQATGIRTSPGTVAGCTDGTTTNRRAQLWKCDPTISGNTSECDAADWSVGETTEPESQTWEILQTERSPW
ncbi:hypothetical protein LEP1GSC088_2045 [Leptospira interrogans str. L1207]|nr:hypothetical protein LEP1GSC088_2045 [Leptospira interrogans str. L1207]